MVWLVIVTGTGATQAVAPQMAVAHGTAQERLQPSLDLAQFQDAKRVPYLDISYAVPLPVLRSESTAAPQSGAFELILDLRVYKNDSLWATKVWKLEEKKSAPAAVEACRELVDRLRYLLSEPGIYRAVLYTRSLQPPATVDSASAALQTRAFTDSHVEVSDVVLASEIRKAAAQTAASTLQGAYEIFPNPRSVYGESVPTLYYYFESYNMRTGLKGASYKCYWRVENENGAPVEGLGQSYRTKKKQSDFNIEMGSINVATLSTGIYTFVYGIADSAQNLQASQRKKFYVYNPSQTSNASAKPAERMLVNASVAELDDEFARMQHIVPRDERKMYQSLTHAEGKSKFILSLWEAHKPVEYPNGMVYRMVYLARAREADAKFATVLRPGWKSDQGRVLILYGLPSNIEREPNNPTLKPYEIWRYDEIQGGVIFVFADRTGFKNYELIHSSHRNELQNPDWQRLITLQTNQQGLQ
ncbi:MAG: GWxTD domain-containing protein [bacterium]